MLVDERLLDIVGGVKLGRLLGRGIGFGRGGVARESAAIFCLDGPDAPLVVHLGPRVLPNTPDEFRVPRRASWLLRRHCFSFSFCFFCAFASSALLLTLVKQNPNSYVPPSKTQRFLLNGPGFLNLTQQCFGLFSFLPNSLCDYFSNNLYNFKISTFYIVFN